MLLTAAAEATGLARALHTALAPWRKPLAVHDPAKVVLDLAVAVALGGDALADAAVICSEPGVYGLVASEATISRTIAALAKDAGKVERAVATARRAARRVAWERAAERAPNHAISAANPLVVDIDATIVVAHSEKKHAAATFKRTFGYHPNRVWCDNTEEFLAGKLRAGNAGSNTTADHIEALTDAITQVPGSHRKKLLIRSDGAGASHGLLNWLTEQGKVRGRSVDYSVGSAITEKLREAIDLVPKKDLDPSDRRRRRDPRGRRSRRTCRPHRGGRAEYVARRDARHRPPRTPAPGCAAVAVRGTRRLALTTVGGHRGRYGDIGGNSTDAT